MFYKLFRGHALIAVCTFLLVYISQQLSFSSFATDSWLHAVGLAVAVTVVSSVLFYGCAVPLAFMNLKSPGVLLQTVLCTIAGSLGLWLAHLVVPTMVLFGFPEAIYWGFGNTMFIWLCAYSFGILQPELHFFPKFHSSK